MGAAGGSNRRRVEGGGAVETDDVEVVLEFWRCVRLELLEAGNEAIDDGV